MPEDQKTPLSLCLPPSLPPSLFLSAPETLNRRVTSEAFVVKKVIVEFRAVLKHWRAKHESSAVPKGVLTSNSLYHGPELFTKYKADPTQKT